jgi:hypothetical protein
MVMTPPAFRAMAGALPSVANQLQQAVEQRCDGAVAQSRNA